MRFTFKRRPSGSSGKRKPKSEEEKLANKAARREKTLAKAAAAKLEKERARSAFCWHCTKLKKTQVDVFKSRAFSDPKVVRCAVRGGLYVQPKAFVQFEERVSVAWLEEAWPEAATCKWEVTSLAEWEKIHSSEIKYSGWEVLRNAPAKPPPPSRGGRLRAGPEGSSSSAAVEESAGLTTTSGDNANPLLALLSVASKKRRNVVRKPKKPKPAASENDAGSSSTMPMPAEPAVPPKQEMVGGVTITWAEAELECSDDED